MNEAQYDTATPVEQGVLSTISTDLYHQVQSYKELLLDLYSNVEKIKPFEPNDVKNSENIIDLGLVGELRQTRDYLNKNNDLLRFIIQHLNELV